MFDRDIRGEPWSTCSVCKRADPGVCPSRSHRQWCDMMAADPESTAAAMARLPDETRPPVDRRCVPMTPQTYVPPKPDESIRPDELPAIHEEKPPERANYLSWKLLVIACDWRGPISQCGCSETHVCFYGKGRPSENNLVGDVTITDCHACVTEKAT